MTQTPQPDPEGEPRSLTLSAKSEQTEMGFMVAVHSPAANVIVELDLDWDPEYFHAILQLLPQIVEDQMQKYVDAEEETDESD